MDGLGFSYCDVFLFLHYYIETVGGWGFLHKDPDICKILHLVMCEFDIWQQHCDNNQSNYYQMYEPPGTMYYNHWGCVSGSHSLFLFLTSEFLKIADHGIIKWFRFWGICESHLCQPWHSNPGSFRSVFPGPCSGDF